MKLTILDNIRSRFLKLLASVGGYLNQSPTKDEEKKLSMSPLFRLPYWKSLYRQKARPENQKMPKNVYGHSGSGYKSKGSINTDAATFEHPRKDIPQGRRH